MVAAIVVASCAKEDTLKVNNGNGVTLYGYTENFATKTTFGTPGKDYIPYKWSAEDYIWVDGIRSKAVTDLSEDYARFVFGADGPASASNVDVYYNMTGSGVVANVPAGQTQDGVTPALLGKNGDFGYATTDENGKFVLTHATSNIWLNIYGEVTKKLKSITVTSDKDEIAGEAYFSMVSKKFLNTEDGSKSIKLTFLGQGISIPKTENSEITAAVVLLPNVKTGSVLTFKYEFEDGVYYSVEKTMDFDFTPGITYRLTTEITKDDLYTLATCDFDTGETNWNALIDNPEYGGPLLYPTDASKVYEWYDYNTDLYHTLPNNWGDGQYLGGGIAVSNYYSTDYKSKGSYMNQLTVYGTGAHSGNNCAVSYGYLDIVSTQSWGDGRPHIWSAAGPVIFEKMYVNITCYLLSCCIGGNSLTAPLAPDGYVKIIATGYKDEAAFNADKNDNKNTGNNPEVQIFIANGSGFIQTWTEFDLSKLGKVEYIRFNVSGDSDNGYGFSQPAYFAMDDITIRKPYKE